MRPVIRVPCAESQTGLEQQQMVKQQQASNVMDAGRRLNVAPGQSPGAGKHGGRHSGNMNKMLSKVPSLMFEMEDAFEETEGHGRLCDVLPPESEVLERLQKLMSPRSDAEYMLNMHVRFARDEAQARSGKPLGVEALGERLKKLGYAVKVRTALGGEVAGSSCLRNLRHCFLTVVITGEHDQQETVIVDPRFLDQFEIAHSTCRYDGILSVVPTELVAPIERVVAAVGILSEEMSRAFASTGTPLPPWRQPAAMLSKWQPRRSEEKDVPHASPFAQEGGSTQRLQKIREEKSTRFATVAQKLALMGIDVGAFEPQTPPSEGDDMEVPWMSSSEELADDDDSIGSVVFERENSSDDEKNNQVAFLSLP